MHRMDAVCCCARSVRVSVYVAGHTGDESGTTAERTTVPFGEGQNRVGPTNHVMRECTLAPAGEYD